MNPLSSISSRPDSGFTFIEVLACLLVLSMGIAAAVSLTYYAMIMGSRAQGRSTGMATALSVAIDPSPLMHTAASATWKPAGGGQGPGLGKTTGWINGYYVVRTESVGSNPCPGFTCNPVDVDVYDGQRGELVTSYTTWLIKQANVP